MQSDNAESNPTRTSTASPPTDDTTKVSASGNEKSKSTNKKYPRKRDGFNCMDSMIPSLGTIVVFLSCTILEWIYICPWYWNKYPLEVALPVVIPFGLTTVFVCVYFTFASHMNPGFLPKAPDVRFLKLQPSLIQVNGLQVYLKHCYTCHYYRMPRTVHCGTCNHCVDNFDHHCPWVNNCVGRRNYRHFFAFLSCLTVHIFLSIGICGFYVFNQNGRLFSSWETEKAIAFVIAGLSTLILVPVLGLLCFHIHLIWRGLSTYEYVTKKYADGSPFSMGPCNNFIFQLCGPEFPIFETPSEFRDETRMGSPEVQRDLFVKFKANKHKHDKQSDYDLPGSVSNRILSVDGTTDSTVCYGGDNGNDQDMGNLRQSRCDTNANVDLQTQEPISLVAENKIEADDGDIDDDVGASVDAYGSGDTSCCVVNIIELDELKIFEQCGGESNELEEVQVHAPSP